VVAHLFRDALASHVMKRTLNDLRTKCKHPVKKKCLHLLFKHDNCPGIEAGRGLPKGVRGANKS
jgi:hypothetical protein